MTVRCLNNIIIIIFKKSHRYSEKNYESLLGSKITRAKNYFSRTNENISRNNEKNSRRNEKLSRRNEKNSRRNENISRTNEKNSRTNEKNSRRNENISRTNEKNSRTNEKLSKQKKCDLFTSVNYVNRSLSLLNRIKLSLQCKAIIITVRYYKTGRMWYCNLRFPQTKGSDNKGRIYCIFFNPLSMKHCVG